MRETRGEKVMEGGEMRGGRQPEQARVEELLPREGDVSRHKDTGSHSMAVGQTSRVWLESNNWRDAACGDCGHTSPNEIDAARRSDAIHSLHTCLAKLQCALVLR